MLFMKSKKEFMRTVHISINHWKCKGCWHCVEACPRNVLRPVDLGRGHRHVFVINPSQCTGCLKCKKICSGGAITKRKVTGRKGRRNLVGGNENE